MIPAPSIPLLRRWLWRLVLAGAALFVVLTLIAAWIMREQIFQTFLDPGIPFQTYERPPAPDYALAEAWAVRPSAPPEDPDTAAVFFVHPTTYEGGAHWNAPFDRPQEAEVIARSALPNFAAPFLVHDAALYAPHYRQAALYTFLNNREDSVQARQLAFEDVRAAFDAFAREIGPDRPFIIAGAGQGASQALGVLIHQVAPNPELRARLAAAYLMETAVPLDLFAGPLADVPPCHRPEDVRCVIAWAAARSNERGRIEAITQRARAWDASGDLVPVTGRALLCVNPVLWTTAEDYAPARLHRGGAAAEGLDLTEHQLFTMSPAAGRILADLKVPVQVRLYITPASRMPTEFKNLERDITEQLRNYERVSEGKLQFSVHNPQDDEDLQQELAQKGIQPFQVQSVEKDQIGVKLIYSGMTIAYKDFPDEVIPRLLPQTLPNLETLVIAPVYRLTRERSPRVALFAPKQEVDQQTAMMYLQQGMQPPAPQDRFSLVKQLLGQEHYEVQEIELTEDSPIPADVDVLLVLGPRDLQPRQVWEINRALSNGLPVMMAVQAHEYGYQPGQRGSWMINGTATASGLEDMLGELGLTVVTDHFLDQNSQMLELPREVNLGGMRMQVREPVDTPVQIRITQDQVNTDQPVTNHIGQLLYLWGTPIDLDESRLAEHDLQNETLLASSYRSWRAPFGQGMLTASEIDPAGKQMLGQQPLAVLATGEFPDTFQGGEPPPWPATAPPDADEAPAGPGRVAPLQPATSQLLLIGCAKMFDDMVLQGAQNALLLLNAVDYLTGSEDLLTIRSKQLTQRTIRPVTAGERIAWQFIAIALMPIVFIIVGVVRTAKRRGESARYRRELHGGA